MLAEFFDCALSDQLTLRISVLELVLQRLTFALWQRLHESQGVLTADGGDNIIRWCTQELSDDGELVDVVLAWEQGLALQHFCEDTAGTPDVHLNIVLLPREHDLGRSVVSSRDVAGHLRVLNTGETKVADFQVTILVDEDVRGLQITMHDSRRMHIFETTLKVSALPLV